jgi:hypothetical protein
VNRSLTQGFPEASKLQDFMQATVEALRSQLEVAHHQPLCATADSACAGSRFLDSDRATCMRALDRATSSLEAVLPILSENILQLERNGATKPCTIGLLGESEDGSPVTGRLQQGLATTFTASKRLQDVDVKIIVKELQQLHDVIHAACMFSNQVCSLL